MWFVHALLDSVDVTSGRKDLKECIKVFVLSFNVTVNHSEIGKGKNIVRKMCGIPGDFRKKAVNRQTY